MSHSGKIPTTINLSEKFSQIDAYWRPKIVGAVNESYVKLVKLQGEFVWHHHEIEDELFLVLKGRLKIELRDSPALEINAGQFAIIHHGVEHRPVADEEAHVLLLEPKTTSNTGNVMNERTVDAEWI